MSFTRERGDLGEWVAADWLRRNGFLIMERNWRYGRYEIDIIASRWDTVHFVEVKTRHTGSLTTPEDAITEDKARALRKAASAYIAARHLTRELQFDLIAVEIAPDGASDVRYVENAMQYGW